MSAGGTFQTQNKIRPGAYINFFGVPKPLSSIAERGIVAAPLSLSWGPQVLELSAQELLSGESLPKAGVSFADPEALPIRLLLQSCAKAVIYRLNFNSAVVAEKTVEGLKIKAKYPGAFGNKLSVSIAKEESVYIVKTFVKDVLKDTQRVANPQNLLPNAFVSFEATSGTLAPASNLMLESGGDGSEDSDISAALAAFEHYDFNTLAISQTETSTKAQALLWTETMRKDLGIKVQIVLSEHEADTEAAIITCQGYKMTDGQAVSKAQAVLAVASLQAGASITKSLTGEVLPNAEAVTDPPTKHDDIEKQLLKGKFLLTRRKDGAIVCEKDQNSLHTFTPSKGYIFSKNRPLRVLDQIGNDIKALFNKNYLGKVSNNEEGRAVFKADLASYFRQLEALGAIQNFSIDDIEILPGNDVDAVVVNLFVQPVDSMEKLYMTVNVQG